MSVKDDKRLLSRRDFARLSAAGLAVPMIGRGAPAAASGPQVIRRPPGGASQGLNIVFVFTDQERYFGKLARRAVAAGPRAPAARRRHLHANHYPAR